MPTLTITSPLTKGQNVENLQKLLISAGYLKSAADGQYGPITAQAAFRAKYWLGYIKPDHNAGDLLISYLKGTKQPDTAMKLLAAKRKKTQNAADPIRIRMLKEARTHIGEKESPPNSNHILYTSDQWWNMVGPWCAMFVSYCGVKAGSKAFKQRERWAYVPYMEHDAKAGLNNLTIAIVPQPGDILTFDWDGDGVADHVGLIDHFGTNGVIHTVEGNTSVGNDSNGGEVMSRERDRSLVHMFIHVGA